MRLVFLLLFAVFLYADPAWMVNPPYGVVGFAAKNSNEELQTKIALISAKAELAKERKIHIQSEIDQVNENFTSHSVQSSSQYIDDVKIIEKYKASDGALYLWVCQ